MIDAGSRHRRDDRVGRFSGRQALPTMRVRRIGNAAFFGNRHDLLRSTRTQCVPINEMTLRW